MRSHPTKPTRRDQTIVGYLEKVGGRSRIYASEQDAKALHPMQVFQKAREKFADAAEAWLNWLEGIQVSQFEDIVSKVPSEIMSQQARSFSLCLMELNRTALITRTFQYA